MKKSLFALLALLHIACITAHAASTINLDSILAGASTNSTIRLEAGVYVTAGVNESGSPHAGAYLKPGCSLIGKGAGRTIIVLAVTNDVNTTAIWGLGGNLVAELTVDCGVTEPTTAYSLTKRNGVYLQPGSKLNRVNGVTVLHTYGNFATKKEGFGIIVDGSRSAITGCTVAEPRGDYVQGFGMVGSATVQNCQVIFPTDIVNGTLTCFGQGSGTNVTYINCHSRGGSSGWYFDTGNVRNLRIENCTFTDAPVGIMIKNQYQPSLTQHVSNVSIKNNLILLSPTNSLVAGIVLNNTRLDAAETTHNSGSINDITIQNNFIGYKPSDQVPTSGSNLRQAIALVSNATTPVKGVAGINTVTISGNTYQSIPAGEPWKHRNKWSAATNITVSGETALSFITN